MSLRRAAPAARPSRGVPRAARALGTPGRRQGAVRFSVQLQPQALLCCRACGTARCGILCSEP